jgi:hypothetical protein
MNNRSWDRALKAPAVLATLIVLAGTGCVPDLHGLKVMYPAAGGDAALMFGDEGYCSPGGATLHLPPTYEVHLKGEWIEIGDATDLSAVVVRTPRGLVTAADLAAAERPATVATMRGDDIEMICVCTAIADADRHVSCADSNGDRWVDHPSPDVIRDVELGAPTEAPLELLRAPQ